MNFITSLNENSGASMALLTTVYVIGTFVIAWVSIRSVREQQATRHELERPRIVAYIENDNERGVSVLILRNVGRGTATDVSISADPPLLNPIHPDLSIDSKKYLIREGTPIMVPDYEIRSLLGTYGNWDTPPVPTPVIHISYSDVTGDLYFEESYALDMSPFFDMPASRPKGVHSVAEELKKLNSTLAKVAESLTP